MIKKISRWIMGLCILICLSMNVMADNRVSSLSIDAVINADGSMYVTQVWDGRFETGTENYIPMKAPSYLTISHLIVNDLHGTYETVSEWDVDWSFEEKAHKAGILQTDRGYEICFGISEYGSNRYSIEYQLDQVIGRYTDCDGVNFRFVNDQMNTTPTDVTLRIRLADGTPITDEIANVWGFGYDGQVFFENGTITAYTEQPITAENYLTILMSFDSGVLSPTRIAEGSFEAVKEQAFSGSDYEEGEMSDAEAIIWVVLAIVVPCLIGWAIYVGIKKVREGLRKKGLDDLADQVGTFSELPNQGDLNVTYVLAKQFLLCQEGDILGAGILRLIDLGCVIPEIIAETSGGLTKGMTVLNLTEELPDEMTEYDEVLYDLLKQAAGSKQVIKPNSLKRFSQGNAYAIRAYLEDCAEAGRCALDQMGCMNKWRPYSYLKDLTPNGMKELGEILGFKCYLEHLSELGKQTLADSSSWKEWMAVAVLLGCAQELTQELKGLYPEIRDEIDTYYTYVYTSDVYYHMMYQNMRDTEIKQEIADRNSGSGGDASYDGGSGSIGGDSGGGSR